jgi:hypothetical protein
MNRVPVSSSNIAEVGFEENSGTLEILFHNNSLYHYYGVPESVYQGLISASSVGGYLHQHVKGVYPYEQQ